MAKRIDNLDWLPVSLVSRDLKLGSKQVVLLYKPYDPGASSINYITSNPDYALANAEKHGFTEFALLVDV